MNFIIIISDSLRRDFLGCYGNRTISTPNIDKFSNISLVFDKAYIGSFPTVPARHEILTGKFTFTYHKWASLPQNDITIPKILKEKGYISMGIFDTPHPFAPGMNYQRDFDGWILIRGQENDKYITEPIDIKLPCKPEKLRNPYTTVIQYLKNVSRRMYEEDYFCAKTFIEASRWIEKNYKHEKFFLYIDTFDPHEPWDPPKYFVDMYDPDYKGEEVIYPRYGSTDIFSDEEIKHCRALYSGEVSLVDRWFGYFMRKLEDTGLLENTVIIFTSDHGFYLGEHNLIGKSILEEGSSSYTYVPLYEELCHIPLLIYIPKVKPKRIDLLVQPVDILPTIIEFADISFNDFHGKSIIKLIEGKEKKEISFSAPSIINGPGAGEKITIIDKDGWCLIFGGEKKIKGNYEIFAVDGLKRKSIRVIEWPDELYFIPEDPYQKRNIIKENPKKAEELKDRFYKFLTDTKTDKKIVNLWFKERR
jgi:arylsulfatase A-like enzyme